MDNLLHSSTYNVDEQAFIFFEEVTFIGATHKPVLTLLTEQVERLEALQSGASNAFRAAAIEYLTGLYIDEVGKRPPNELLNRLGNVMDADFIFAVYKEDSEYSSVTERQMRTRLSRETSSMGSIYVAVDGKNYSPPVRYRKKAALD